jgi:CheY-like chemotaxis protein
MFSGITAEQEEPELEQVSLLELVRGALELSRSRAEARGVSLTCNSFHNFPPMLLDPQRITEAIHALVEPVVAAAPADSGVDLMLAGRDGQAELLITWRGSPQPLANEPCPLPDRPRLIIEAQGGRLTRETGAGGCCSLSISLPVIRPAMQMDALDTGLHDRETDDHLHILLAEDSLMNRKLAASLLEKKGHLVTQVSNGREAVSAFLVGHFDLVLMDIQMPLMNGHDATELIRRMDSGRGKRVPIVALTASEAEASRQRCRESGMDALLSKPFKGDDFDRLLERLKSEALEAHRTRLAKRDATPA